MPTDSGYAESLIFLYVVSFMISYFPKFFSSRAIYLYLALLLVVTALFGHPMKWYWWLFGVVEVIGFFYLSSQLTIEWGRCTDRLFEKKLFSTSLIIRVVYVVFSYFFYIEVSGDFMGFGAADANTYHLLSIRGAEMISSGQFNFKEQFDSLGFFSRGIDISDMGYPLLQSIVYFFSGNSRIISRLVNCLFSACTALYVYRFSKRYFGENIARMTAVFFMLMPNFIYYCSVQLKETVMLFITVMFVKCADRLIHEKKIELKRMLFVLFYGLLMFFFRAVLCYVLFISLFVALVLTSSRLARRGRNLLFGLVTVLFIGVVWGNLIREEIVWGQYQDLQTDQQNNLEWRAEREGGNQLARYAGSAVFAPLIFTIPFPTMVEIPDQENQQMIHGGNYVKNITSFFTIIALITLLMTRKWKEQVLPAAFFIGYLVVLVFSNYAQSERFHIPILPFSLMFAAYGVSLMTNKHKLWFQYWLLFIFVANIGWAWFKLRGRGL